jgi:hypothetical protein
LNAKPTAQPWIHSASLDTAFILSPSLLATGVVLLFGHSLQPGSSLSVVQWVVLVLLIDVAHVYSTLYRTYFDPEEFRSRRTLYVLIPLVAAVGGIMLYAIGPLVFWKTLAYLAVFHFVRQQYGFMMIYGRMEKLPPWCRTLDKAAIYSSTIYPLIYWHTHMPRNFSWFIDGDFFHIDSAHISNMALVVYLLIIGAYITKEFAFWIRTNEFNLPRNLLLLGTAVSWFVGIVYLNSDLAFTATNVVAHGIPYMALVWVYERKKVQKNPDRKWTLPISRSSFFSLRLVPVYLGLLVLLAYLEEGFWDGFIWREHMSVFPLFRALPRLRDDTTLTWLVPLLALPQSTHYLLDGFIWRLKHKNTEWTRIAFEAEPVGGGN